MRFAGNMKHEGKQRKLNNAGSAIVTVLVVIAFLTILATVMLYISGVNYQMKVTDYRTKESFYQAETPVEELRAQLVEDVETAFARAYTAAISEYSGLGDEAREANYRQLFCDEMNQIWIDRCGTLSGSTNLNWAEGIAAVLTPAAGGGTWTAYTDSTSGEKTGSGRMTLPNGGIWEIAVEPAAGFDDSRSVSNGQLILQDVTFTYDSPEGYTSIISTDYCITIPQIDWSDTFAEEAAVTEQQLDFSGCVNYMNWTKQ